MHGVNCINMNSPSVRNRKEQDKNSVETESPLEGHLPKLHTVHLITERQDIIEALHSFLKTAYFPSIRRAHSCTSCP